MDIHDLAKAYIDGSTLEELSRLSGLSRPTLTRRLRKETHCVIRGPGLGKPKPKELGPEWDDIGKVPDEELAERLACTRQNVASHRKRRGIPSYRSTKRSRHGRDSNPDGASDV
jgi:hypothetical protein